MFTFPLDLNKRCITKNLYTHEVVHILAMRACVCVQSNVEDREIQKHDNSVKWNMLCNSSVTYFEWYHTVVRRWFLSIPMVWFLSFSLEICSPCYIARSAILSLVADNNIYILFFLSRVFITEHFICLNIEYLTEFVKKVYIGYQV